MTTVEQVPVIRVVVDGPRRAASRPAVLALAESIGEVGLLNPITVLAPNETFAEYGHRLYPLVAGLHRLEAVKKLGWKEITAVVVQMSDLDRRIAEIDENLIRNDLSELEHAECVKQRKHIYELKHPEAKAGARRAAGMNRTLGRGDVGAESAPTFAADTATKTGRSQRVIEEEVQIVESIPEDVRDAIRETPLADSKTDLLAMARLPEAAQREIVSTVDMHDKPAFRQAVAERRPVPRRAPDPEIHDDQVQDVNQEPEPETTEVLLTVEGFARAIVSLFDAKDCRRIARLITENTEARAS